METIKEVWAFMRMRKKFWLLPIFIALLMLAGLFWFAGVAGPLAPWIYGL